MHLPDRPGIHHLCLRARSRGDIDQLYGFLQGIGANIVRAPEEGPWAPGYYSVSFLDPAGIRLEVNHVPGKGVFAEGASFQPAPGYPVTGRRGRPRRLRLAARRPGATQLKDIQDQWRLFAVRD